MVNPNLSADVFTPASVSAWDNTSMQRLAVLLRTADGQLQAATGQRVRPLIQRL